MPFLAQPRAASGRGRAVAGRPLAGAWGNAEPTPPPPRQAPPRQAPRARPGCRRPAGSPPRSLTRALEALLSRLGSDPPRPPSAPSPRRHACAVKSGALVKAATNDAAIKARCGAPAAKRARGPSPNSRDGVPRVRGLSPVQDLRSRKGKENERGVA